MHEKLDAKITGFFKLDECLNKKYVIKAPCETLNDNYNRVLKQKNVHQQLKCQGGQLIVSQ